MDVQIQGKPSRVDEDFAGTKAMKPFVYRAREIGLKRIAVLVVIASAFSSPLNGQTGGTAQEEPVFRAPFALKLHIDKEHYYQQTFDHVPYVADGAVYLFAGETFGINVAITDNRLSGITYQRDPAKADVELKFTQETSPDGFMMLLVTRNKLKRKLFFDAVMTEPGKKEIYKTSVLPVEPNLSNFESWPHPIVQLVLSNFRFTESGSP
jgi:hypothetical protein